MLHHTFLKRLVPTTNRCMGILLTRHRVLHDYRFIDPDMEENFPVGTHCLLKPRIDPEMHVVTCITGAIEWGVNQSSKDSFILLVNEPFSHVG